MKKAFTLAEVLITLGIIGVVAALTMPTVINQTKNVVTMNRLKKMYSVMSQAIQRTVMTEGWAVVPLQDSSNASIENWYKEMFEKNIKVSKYCVDVAGCWNDGTLLLNGTRHSSDRGNIGIGGNCLSFVTPDGYIVLLDAWSGDDLYTHFDVDSEYDALSIYVDTNAYKKPNIIGKDIFVFTYTMERGLLPAGRDADDATVNADCSPTGTGIYCAEQMVREGWKIK